MPREYTQYTVWIAQLHEMRTDREEIISRHSATPEELDAIREGAANYDSHEPKMPILTLAARTCQKTDSPSTTS